MGQQQLLLVVLGMVLVGIAVVVAVTMFQANAIESSRNAITNDLLYFATKARGYYWRPVSFGGGNHSFAGITMGMLSSMSQNENGRYYIESNTTSEVVFVGVGLMVSGLDTVRVRMRVNEQNSVIEVLN
jgi:hypothetical protein